MSAAMYTNRIRTKAEARVRKVQYRFMEASNYNPLASTCNADPDYTVLSYAKANCCIPVQPLIPKKCPTLYDGGTAVIVYPNILDGGTATILYQNILDGGQAIYTSNPLCTTIYTGDNAGINYTDILDGGTATIVYQQTLNGGNSAG